jgi:hypothetical protein
MSTVLVNGLSLSHKGSGGYAKNTVPDVCKTPSPGGPIPVPYPAIFSFSRDLANGTVTVTVDGGNSAAIKPSEFQKCSGDEPGSAGGVTSNTFMKEAKWLLYSFSVKMEGENCCRKTDKMTMNHGNCFCLAGEDESGDGTPGNNQEQNKQFRGAVREAEKQLGKKLSKKQQRMAHDAVSGQNFGFWGMVEEIVGLFS